MARFTIRRWFQYRLSSLLLLVTACAIVAYSVRDFFEATSIVQRKLEAPITCHFERTPLKDVIDSLGRQADVEFRIDPRGLAAEGVAMDTPTTINLSDPYPLKTVLALTLEPLNLDYAIEGETIVITSYHLAHKIEVRSYDVTNLVRSQKDLELFADFINYKALLASETMGNVSSQWMRDGRKAVLVVRDYDEVHEGLVKLLRGLRKNPTVNWRTPTRDDLERVWSLMY